MCPGQIIDIFLSVASATAARAAAAAAVHKRLESGESRTTASRRYR